jgi:hypothetical protein
MTSLAAPSKTDAPSFEIDENLLIIEKADEE